jgi:SAM-dependent methyltransferase
MKPSFVNHLVCPFERSPLALEIHEMDGDEVQEGLLHTPSGRSYPIRAGVPRFVASDDYVNTFSRQRQHVRSHFDTYRREFDYNKAAELFIHSTGFDLSHLDGLTLDVGCGYGRFLRVLAEAGGEVVGVDLSSDTVELAYHFVGRNKNVHIVQASLAQLPFPECHFRRGFSIGVLHHTPDTRTSFLGLLPYLEEGADIAVWVYAPEKKIASNAWRKLTTRLPLGLVYGWCVINELLFVWPRSLPKGGGRFHALVPGGSLGTPFWQRVMGDFDDLTPRYAHTHSTAEVVQWFRDAELVDIQPLSRATSVRARKPHSGARQRKTVTAAAG